jgi:hypothetical protein
MLSSTEAAGVAFVLVLRLTKKKNRRWIKEWHNRGPQCAHEDFMKDLRLSESNDKKSVLRLDGSVI